MQSKMLDIPSQLSDPKWTIQDAERPRSRAYKNWKGNNKFFLGGRFIFGPDVRSMFFTIFLIVVPVFLLTVFISQDLINEFGDDIGNYIVAVAILSAAYVIFLLLLTSSRDPGIIPRNEHPPVPEEDASSTNSVEWVGSQSGAPGLPPTKDVSVNGVIVKVKYCNTCMMYRPPRCSHCSICNNCVERFDHHCPWVGQCIGKRNYRSFFMFVSSTTLLCLYVLACCCINLVKIMEANGCNLWEAITKSPASGVVIVYTFIAAWFVGGLTTFHVYLASRNQTTYENFRSRYDGKINPYNRGFIRNIIEICFSRIPNSHHNFRQKVNPRTNSLPSVNPRINSLSFGLSLGRGQARQDVAEEVIADISSRIESTSRLERCGTEPAHPKWGDRKASWENSNKDIEALAAEFGMEHGLSKAISHGAH